MSGPGGRAASGTSGHPGTRLALLLGDPVAHSLSPRIHAAAFEALGIDAIYLASRVPARALGAAVAGLRQPQVLGANVTIPHKQDVIPFLDELDSTADAIGAVNTIINREGQLVGHNTDAAGFMTPLAAKELNGRPVAILGSGGAARAAGFALLTHASPSVLTFAARSPDRAETIARDLPAGASGADVRVSPLAEAGAAVRDALLVVNATPVGMHPRVSASPWPDPDAFHAGQIVYDLVYNPRQTLLLKQAASRGARTIDGLEMLIGQAAIAFELWTGQEMPIEVARAAVDHSP